MSPSTPSRNPLNTGDPEIDALDPAPSIYTGKFDFNPRHRDTYPDTTEGLVELIVHSQFKGANERTVALREEFQQQKFRAQGERVPEIPPKPLTVRELHNVIPRLESWNQRDVAVWVPCEYSDVNNLAVGEYREHVEGYILRFQVEYENTLWEYGLVPDDSDVGFGWYVKTDESPVTTDGQLDIAQSRRLEGLLGVANPEEILNPPDDILYASRLLDTPLIKGDLSPTPEGWVTTSCTRDWEASELFFPRYNATFVYPATGAVVEITPVAVEMPEEFFHVLMQQRNGGTPQPPHGAIRDSRGFDDSPGTKEDNPLAQFDPGPGHRWTLHFVPDDVKEVIEAEFNPEVEGKVIKHLLRKISDLLES